MASTSRIASKIIARAKNPVDPDNLHSIRHLHFPLIGDECVSPSAVERVHFELRYLAMTHVANFTYGD